MIDRSSRNNYQGASAINFSFTRHCRIKKKQNNGLKIRMTKSGQLYFVSVFLLRIKERSALPPPEKSEYERNDAVEFNKSRSLIVSINGFDTEYDGLYP